MMKKFVVISAALILSACGFTPMHAPNFGEDGMAFKNIKVNLKEDVDIANDEGAFWVQQALYDRLGTQGEKHVLTVTPRFTRIALGISARDVATRYDLTLKLRYVLTEAESGDILDQGTATAVSTFGAPLDPYGRTSAQQAATKNLAIEAADRVLVRLAAYYANVDK